MNNPNMRQYAKGMSGRIASDRNTTIERAVQAGYLSALARAPTPEELGDAVAFVQEQMASYQAAGKGDGREPAFADFCQVLMCLNEFVYVD